MTIYPYYFLSESSQVIPVCGSSFLKLLQTCDNSTTYNVVLCMDGQTLTGVGTLFTGLTLTMTISFLCSDATLTLTRDGHSGYLKITKGKYRTKTLYVSYKPTYF